MSTEKVFAEGLFVNTPREGAPDFVLGQVAITKKFLEFATNNPQYFNEKGYLRLDLLKGKEEGKGYASVNTYGLTLQKTEQAPLGVETGDLPF